MCLYEKNTKNYKNVSYFFTRMCLHLYKNGSYCYTVHCSPTENYKNVSYSCYFYTTQHQ